VNCGSPFQCWGEVGRGVGGRTGSGFCRAAVDGDPEGPQEGTICLNGSGSAANEALGRPIGLEVCR
jgi:hypothetical protein